MNGRSIFLTDGLLTNVQQHTTSPLPLRSASSKYRERERGIDLALLPADRQVSMLAWERRVPRACGVFNPRSLSELSLDNIFLKKTNNPL